MPDELSTLKPQVYREERPPEAFTRYHEHVRSHEPDWVWGACWALLAPWCMIALRARPLGLRNMPSQAGVILAPNHFSAMDHFLVAMFLHRRVRFMAKSQLFKPPLDFVLTHGGAFPVRRGRRDDEAIATGVELLNRGQPLVIYPEGGRSRSGTIGDRARPGVGRLALATGAPVVPVAIHGSAQVRNWKRLQFPRVTVLYGPPVAVAHEPDAPRERQQEVSDRVLDAVRELHSELVARDRPRG